jgi:phosphoribosyl 1,2-cyclic phosphodiesterase
MELEVLASGSAANCYILSAGEDKLILDAGVKFKDIQKALDFNYSGVAACLLTHSHLDHTRAAKDVTNARIYTITSRGTADNIHEKYAGSLLMIRAEEEFKTGNWRVMPFEIQHDTAEPLGYLIMHIKTRERLIYATDTYYLKYSFPGINYWLIEANYCTDRLISQYEAGEINASLYKRLLQSHMSLENLKTYMARQDLKSARKIVLLHLSDARSDEKRMVKEIQELTGVDTVAAKAGLTVELNKYPF